ncbi:MAG: DUF1360 domain-containing protein [Phycisphaerae bacterium]|nr:DUF1360 domain-containing protein [Phycisphaerae bacterium]
MLGFIDSDSEFVRLAAWLLGTWGLGYVLFRSFWAREFAFWYQSRHTRQMQQIGVLRWELEHNLIWNEALAQGDDHAARRELTSEQREARRTELNRLARGTVFQRAVTFLLACRFCHNFWSALVLLIVFGPHGLETLPLAIAYAAGARVLDRVIAGSTSTTPKGGRSCPDCM